MQFLETKLSGAWLIDAEEPTPDHRGFFAQTFCAREFAQHGLETDFVQHSTSYSSTKGTLRGIHFQRAPHTEVKIVRCLKGAIWDVIIDLLPRLADLSAMASFRADRREPSPALRPQLGSRTAFKRCATTQRRAI